MAQKVRIIGVPMDLGQSRRGVDMGPSALRGAGLQARSSSSATLSKTSAISKSNSLKKCTSAKSAPNIYRKSPKLAQDIAKTTENLWPKAFSR